MENITKAEILEAYITWSKLSKKSENDFTSINLKKMNKSQILEYCLTCTDLMIDLITKSRNKKK